MIGFRKSPILAHPRKQLNVKVVRNIKKRLDERLQKRVREGRGLVSEYLSL